MTIDLKPEDQRLIEELVAQGRFSSASDAVSANLELIQAEEAWTQYAKQRIDAGVEALARGDFASEKSLDQLFARYNRKSA